MYTKKKGISLIVLVITIIVMIILAAAIILSISGSDIRGKANEAVSSNDIASAKELVAVARSEWETNYDELSSKYEDFGKYATEKIQKTDMKNVVVSKDGIVNVLYTDENRDTAVIPEGFYVSTVASEQTINKGLVILDENGNEFVWVPVNNINMFKRTTVYDGTEIKNPVDNYGEYSEPFKALNDPTGEEAEHTAMCASVEKYNGFYIARYEAGKGQNNTVVSKKGATVWNNIPWATSMSQIGTEGAVYKSRQMYKGSKSVVSTLCYGVQWDSVLQFISTGGEENKKYINDSSGKGNYTYGRDFTAEVLAAGSSNDYAVNNIYDMAGNVSEWTMEAYSSSFRTFRGGGCYSNSMSSPVSSRYFNDYDYVNDDVGFRVALYIK